MLPVSVAEYPTTSNKSCKNVVFVTDPEIRQTRIERICFYPTPPFRYLCLFPVVLLSSLSLIPLTLLVRKELIFLQYPPLDSSFRENM